MPVDKTGRPTGERTRKRTNSNNMELTVDGGQDGGGPSGVVVPLLAPPTPNGPASVTHKRTLSMSQLLMLNAIVCGLEFCASAAFCYIPPMLLKAGISEENMSMILGVGPLLGFFIVPVIGRASDRCRSPYGRRRPFIFALSILLVFSLFIIPYGESFGVYMFGKGALSKSTGISLLVLGSVILDFTSQACLTPCEALLSDACKSTNQQDRCFMVYSFMVSLGGCIGYLITALDWSTSSVGLYFGNQEKSAFSMLIILFTLSMIATLGIAQEHPVIPDSDSSTQISEMDTQLQKKLDQVHQALIHSKGLSAPVVHHDPGYETGSNQSLSEDYMNMNGGAGVVDASTGKQVTAGGSTGINMESPKHTRSCPSILISDRNCNIPLTRISVTSIEGFCHLVRLRVYALLPETIQSLLNVPFVLKRLAFANFCSWTAVMCFNLFFTDFVGQAVYGGDPNAPENSHLQELYDEGVRMGSWGLLFHCITSAIYAVFVERMVARFGTRLTYFLGMFSFTIAMTVMVFARSIVVVNMMAAATGIAYATVTTIPFVLVTQYHSDKETYFIDTRVGEGSLPNRGTGSDMATLDSAYFLSQVILTAFMGYIVHYTGTVLAYIVCAGAAGAVACACVTRIVFTRGQMRHVVSNKDIVL